MEPFSVMCESSLVVADMSVVLVGCWVLEIPLSGFSDSAFSMVRLPSPQCSSCVLPLFVARWVAIWEAAVVAGWTMLKKRSRKWRASSSSQSSLPIFPQAMRILLLFDVHIRVSHSLWTTSSHTSVPYITCNKCATSHVNSVSCDFFGVQ